MIRLAQPLISDEEREAVMAVLNSGQLASGPVTRQLEETFAREVSHTDHAVAVANGTAALHVALLAHDIGPGDEVITTPFTFQATSNMVLAVGARPVFIDIRDDGNIDTALIEAAITPRTSAILPVDLYGRLAAMPAISGIAARHGLAVIEDACQAHGASDGERSAGGFGTGCFSFYATKNMTAGEGGMITTNDTELAARMRRIRSHGEAERYKSTELGFNYRLTDVAAAIALVQTKRLPDFTAKRRHNAEYLSANLRGVLLPPAPPSPESHVWHLYTVRVPDGRAELLAYLREREIEAGAYYPNLLPDQPLYTEMGYTTNELPIARQLANEVVSLPCHPGLSEDDLQRIVEAVNAWSETRAPARS